MKENRELITTTSNHTRENVEWHTCDYFPKGITGME